MESGLSASDVALMSNNNDWGGNSFLWIFALLILANGGFGGWGNNRMSDFSQYATAASQNEILSGQKFDSLSRQINQVGDGLCSSTYALNNAIHSAQDVVSGSVISEGRALQTQLANCCCENQRNTDALRYDMAQQFSMSNANTTAQTQKILDALAQNKIDSLQAQVSELKTQNMFCGIPRISNYAYGVYPYATNGGCNCGTV